MSPELIAMFAAELPRIEAHESLRRMTEIAVGTGSLKPGDARVVVRSWERATEPPRPAGQRRRRGPTAAELQAFGEATGVQIEELPRG